MNQWVLQVNPNSFRLTQGAPVAFYQIGADDWWGISRYFNSVKAGDSAYIWQSIDYRYSPTLIPRGIHAKATIKSVPPHKKQFEVKITELKKRDVGAWQDPKEEAHQKAKHPILITYIDSYASNPLTENDLKTAGLAGIGPLGFPHSDIYKISDSDCRKIEVLLKGR